VKTLKQFIIATLFTLTVNVCVAQLPPAFGTPNPGGNWTRGTNSNGANTLGSAGGWNSPIYFATNGNTATSIRMKINGTFAASGSNTQYTINGFNWNNGVNTTGYVGIGMNDPILTNSSLLVWSTKGPFSLLHLNGNNYQHVQELGYRPWMKIGMTVTSNDDLMYVGHKRVSDDVTDAVFAWSDNAGTSWGPDNLLFIFTRDQGGSSPLDLTGNSLDGREIMRLNALGNVGIGPRFNNSQQPQSTLHINQENNASSWFQITNQSVTGQTITDGLRIGIIGTTGAINFQQQENQPIIFLTDWDNNSGGIADGERLRITAVGQTSVPDPNSMFCTNPGRVAISEDGSNPITKPRSLLHLGYNTGMSPNQLNYSDGWRKWMDIGMFVSSGYDNLYLGLKYEGPDRHDAILNWGDNQEINPATGPDNLRFIFTSIQETGISTVPANLNNGMEALRMTPTTSDLVYTGIGGNPGVLGYIGTNLYYGNSINPTLTLEVNSPATTIGPSNSGLRFTDLNSTSGTINNPGNGVLSVDETGKVVYVPYAGGANFGAACTDPTPYSLTDNWGIGLSDYNLYFYNANPILTPNRNSILIGEVCNVTPQGKLHVHQNSGLESSTGIWVENDDMSQVVGPVKGIHSEITQTGSNGIHIAGEFITHGQKLNIAVLGRANGAANLGSATVNYGGKFLASKGIKNYGVEGYVFGSAVPPANNTTGYGIWGQSEIQAGSTQHVYNYGGHFEAKDGSNDYGVWAKTDGNNSNDWAAWLEGDVYHNGAYYPSDSTLKQHLDTITNAYNILKSITPYTFIFKQDVQGLNLPSGKQYGFCAQQVQTILPELVKQTIVPVSLDSNGNVIIPELNFLTINTEQLIPVIVASIFEQERKFDSLKVTADNGLNIYNNNIQLGGTLNQLTNINLNNKKLIFSDPANAEINTNNITVGSDVGFSSKFGVNNFTDKAAGVFLTTFPGYTSGNWGIIAAANGTWGNIGGQFAAENGSSVNYGIFSSGRGGQSNAAGYFDGDLVYTGELYKASDLMLKENIVPISSALNTISQLQPKTFNFKTTEYPDMNLPTGSKFGLIAQEVETIVPGLVKNVVHPATYDSAMNIVNEAFNYKSVDYEGFIPILIQAVKELGQQNSQKDSLLQGMNDRLTQLEAMFTQCCNSNNKTLVNPNGNDITISEVELENRLAVVLDQNVPNPFAENTIINYFIPDEIKFAQIIFSDNYGKIIKTVDINNSGYGVLKVYAANLSSGIYTYSIIIDGKVVDTKKMVCAK